MRIIGRFPKGTTSGEIIDEVTAESDIAVSTIRQALRELEEEKKVITFREPPQKEGRPRNIYRLVLFESEIAARDTILKDTVDQQRELEESDKLLEDLVKGSLGRYQSPHKAREIYGRAAEMLRDMDPVELYCQFALWLEQQFLNEINEWNRSKDDRRKREEHRQLLESIMRLAEHVFFRTLGVPVEARDDTGKIIGPGPVALVLDRNKMQPTYSGDLVNREMLTKYLRQSVFGKRVFEKIELQTFSAPLRLGGSDSSAQPIDLSRVLPWRTESRALYVVTSVGMRYDVYEKTSDKEWHPEPKVLAQYERKKAIEEGLLIPPEAEYSSELGRGMMARVREAALDLRQYVKDHEILFEKEPSVQLHFRDGRVFPLEHRFGDAVDWGLHGELVRTGLRKFRTILNNMTAAGGALYFCGFVKRTFFDIIAALIDWYIGFGSGSAGSKPIDPNMTLLDLFHGGTDSSTLAYVFAALNVKNPGVYTTFRILRRFQSLQEDFIAEARPTTDSSIWLKRLANHSSFISVRGVPPDALDVYASLLARANILMFYTSISAYKPEYERYISIPRIEVLLPYTDIEEYALETSKPSVQENLGHKERAYIQAILSVMFHDKGGILEKYEEDLFPFASTSPKVFLVPKPVNDAHIASKEIAKVYALDFEALLVREAKRYWSDVVGSLSSQN